jgi:hypothetical protein
MLKVHGRLVETEQVACDRERGEGRGESGKERETERGGGEGGGRERGGGRGGGGLTTDPPT